MRIKTQILATLSNFAKYFGRLDSMGLQMGTLPSGADLKKCKEVKFAFYRMKKLQELKIPNNIS